MRPIMPRLNPSNPALAVTAVAALPAIASQPVRKAQIGCVMMTGEFLNQDGYRLTPTGRDGARSTCGPTTGSSSSLDSWLNPGDRYTLAASPRVLGPCPIGR
ncbi:MAG: hypothetical protein HZY79_12950 [Rhodoblastus sp.]|nr:MAG: hypothetical protein HZY79_12950 [Rhodoblastus sp.]